jgi:hypothetical protein
MNENPYVAYRVVSDFDVEPLNQRVNALVAQGWEPIGSVSGFYHPHLKAVTLIQALVLRHPEKEAGQ